MYFQLSTDKSIELVTIDFKEFVVKKKNKSVSVDNKIELTGKIFPKKIVLAVEKERVVESEIVQVKIDSSEGIIKTIENRSNWLDSMVLARPNLNTLKYALSKHIKENPVEKTDSAKLVESLRNMMQEYYYKKFPTPVHKFGDGSPGIPIGDIINIFSNDTLNVERIKKYLKIGKYDKKK